jgi:uncharacterized protein (TIGR02598 family)
MKPIQRLSAGFSLAEVVLATGICSVALMSLIGVLGVSLSAERDSARDTALAAMSSQIVARLSKQPFDELIKSVGSASPSADGDGAMPDAVPVFYFDSQGMLITDAGDPHDLSAAYRCMVTQRPCEETKNPTTGACNLVRVEMACSWPVTSGSGSTNAQPTGHQRLYASIARY